MERPLASWSPSRSVVHNIHLLYWNHSSTYRALIQKTLLVCCLIHQDLECICCLNLSKNLVQQTLHTQRP